MDVEGGQVPDIIIHLSRVVDYDQSVSDLQEAHSHEEEAVGADSSGENFIEVPLQQELFQHQDQVRQYRVFLQDQRQTKQGHEKYILMCTTPSTELILTIKKGMFHSRQAQPEI